MKRGHLDLRSMTYSVYCVFADIFKMRGYGIRHCGQGFFVSGAWMAKLTLISVLDRPVGCLTAEMEGCCKKSWYRECGNGLILFYKDTFSYQMLFIFIVDKEGE